MVIDTSALVAILFFEPDADNYVRAMDGVDTLLISTVTRVELTCVVEGRKGDAGRLAIDSLFARVDLEVVPVTERHAAFAIEAFRRFGKGRHKAALNIGDCFSYALAAVTGFPLLYKGDDFAHTNIVSALPR